MKWREEPSPARRSEIRKFCRWPIWLVPQRYTIQYLDTPIAVRYHLTYLSLYLAPAAPPRPSISGPPPSGPPPPPPSLVLLLQTPKTTRYKRDMQFDEMRRRQQAIAAANARRRRGPGGNIMRIGGKFSLLLPQITAPSPHYHRHPPPPPIPREEEAPGGGGITGRDASSWPSRHSSSRYLTTPGGIRGRRRGRRSRLRLLPGGARTPP